MPSSTSGADLLPLSTSATPPPPGPKTFSWPFPGLTSPLRKITLHASNISPHQLNNLLAHSPLLQTFHYTHAPRRPGTAEDWDLYAFLSALLANTTTAHTLTDLSLTTIPTAAAGGHVKAGLRFFKAFHSLRTLELEPRFFFGPDIHRDPALMKLSPSQFREHAFQIHWNGSLLPPLPDLLPASVEKVHFLAGGGGREDILILKALFKLPDLSTTPSSTTSAPLPAMHVTRSTTTDESTWRESSRAGTAWGSVREVVCAAGGTYEEMDVAMPLWLRGEGMGSEREVWEREMGGWRRRG